MGQTSKLSLCVAIIFAALFLVSSERRVIGRDPFDSSKTGDNGWRPLPGTSDRPMFSKDAVGHPVLDKLKAHIEAAEKQQVLYTPPPPTILGSFSAVSRPRKEVYSARLVPPPPPGSIDLQTAQQQQHAFFLAPPTHTLLPPPRSSDFLVDNGFFNQRFPAVGHLQFFPQLKPGVQEAFSVLPQHHQYRDPLQQAHPQQTGLGQQDFGTIFRQQETTSTVSPHGNNQGPTRDQSFYVTSPVTGHRFETKRPALPNIFSEPQIIQGQVTSSRFPQPPTYQQLYNAGQSGHTDRNPNSATSVVGFTLGVSPDNQISTKTTIQHRPQGHAEVDLTHGQRTRVTRPYFGEDGPTASIPQQRPQVTDSDAQSLLSTVPPVPQAFLRKPPNTEQPSQITEDNGHRRPSHRPRRPPQRPILGTENGYGDQTVTSRPRYPSQQQQMIFVTALSDDYPVTPASIQYSQPDVTETYSQHTRRPTNQRPSSDFQNVNTEQQSVDFYGKVEVPSRPLKRPGIKKRPQVISNAQDGYEDQSAYQEEKSAHDYRPSHQTSGPGSTLDFLQNQDQNNGQIIQAHNQGTEDKNVLQDQNSYHFGTDQHIRLQETVTTDQRIVDDQSRYHDGKITQTDRPYQQLPKEQSNLDVQTQHQFENVGNNVRPSELPSDNREQQPQFQNERKRYKGRRPQHQSALTSVGNEEVKPSTEYSHNLPAGNNEIRTRKRRPKPPVKNQEDSTLHNLHHEQVTQVADFETPENIIQTSSYESQTNQEHRKYRRPPINKPQLEHTTPVDVYDNQDRPLRHRRPVTHKRIRPTEEIPVKDYENQEVGAQVQHGQEYNEEQTNNYEDQDIIYRKRQKQPQRVKEMIPSAVDGIAGSDFTSQYSTAEAVSTTVSTPAHRYRQNPYNRNRGKDKYQRKPLTTTTRQPEINQQLTPEESFPATESEIPNDLTDESPSLPQTDVTVQNYGYTFQDDEEDEVPVSTTEALTTTTVATTSTSTTPVPHVSSSMTTINRLRPKLRYGTSNYTRPRFSVKDYKERLKQSQISASTAKPADGNDALDSSVTEAPSSERSRTPRPRGAYHYKPHRNDEVDQSDSPKLSKYRPKDLSRLNSARYRSTSTTAAPYTTERTESGYKSSTSRYRRPVTGKYNSHYRASTEQSATSRMDDELPPEVSSTTSRPVYRPKGVFSAAMRRPFPLRTSNSPPTEATADNAIAESDGSHTLSKTDAGGEEEAGKTAVDQTSVYGMKTNLDIATTTVPTAEDIEADPTPSSSSPPLELPTEQSSPHSEATTTLIQSSASTDSVLPQTSSVVPGVIEADVGTEKHEEEASTPWSEDSISPSQRVADLTSSATLGGYFQQTSSNANIRNSLRITMATEDPILPLEAFFPSWGNKDGETSR